MSKTPKAFTHTEYDVGEVTHSGEGVVKTWWIVDNCSCAQYAADRGALALAKLEASEIGFDAVEGNDYYMAQIQQAIAKDSEAWSVWKNGALSLTGKPLPEAMAENNP